MTSHTTMPRLSTLEVIQTGARRRWPVEEKLRIVAESDRAPGEVSATARRYGVSPAQLFMWRRQVRTGQLTTEGFNGFVPACVVADGFTGTSVSASASCKNSQTQGRGKMIIVLAGGGRIIIGPDVDAAALRRVVEVLERQ